MPQEGGKRLEQEGYTVLYTGLGKVNAAYSLTKYLAQKTPKLVLNLGTAGSYKFPKGSLVQGNAILQRDMDVSPLGFDLFATPFEAVPKILSAKCLFDLPVATVGTGDSFETQQNQNSGDVVDMEAYALAKVCYHEKLDFATVKFISDGADDKAVGDWNNALKNMPEKFTALLKKLI